MIGTGRIDSERELTWQWFSEPHLIYLQPPTSPQSEIAQELELEIEMTLKDFPLSAEDGALSKNLDDQLSGARLGVCDPEKVRVTDVEAVEGGAFDENNGLDNVG